MIEKNFSLSVTCSPEALRAMDTFRSEVGIDALNELNRRFGGNRHVVTPCMDMGQP